MREETVESLRDRVVALEEIVAQMASSVNDIVHFSGIDDDKVREHWGRFTHRHVAYYLQPELDDQEVVPPGTAVYRHVHSYLETNPKGAGQDLND